MATWAESAEQGDFTEEMAGSEVVGYGDARAHCSGARKGLRRARNRQDGVLGCAEAGCRSQQM
jgi:hypothetical protein